MSNKLFIIDEWVMVLLLGAYMHYQEPYHGYAVQWETSQWRHNGRDGISNHQPHDCLLNRLFGCRSKKTSQLSVTGLCAGNSQGTGEFPAQIASYAENVSIWWRHHEIISQFYIQNTSNSLRIKSMQLYVKSPQSYGFAFGCNNYLAFSKYWLICR